MQYESARGGIEPAETYRKPAKLRIVKINN